jgi:hypothetical protein
MGQLRMRAMISILVESGLIMAAIINPTGMMSKTRRMMRRLVIPPLCVCNVLATNQLWIKKNQGGAGENSGVEWHQARMAAQIEVARGEEQKIFIEQIKVFG